MQLITAPLAHCSVLTSVSRHLLEHKKCHQNHSTQAVVVP